MAAAALAATALYPKQPVGAEVLLVSMEACAPSPMEDSEAGAEVATVSYQPVMEVSEAAVVAACTTRLTTFKTAPP